MWLFNFQIRFNSDQPGQIKQFAKYRAALLSSNSLNLSAAFSLFQPTLILSIYLRRLAGRAPHHRKIQNESAAGPKSRCEGTALVKKGHA
jgi:hypothetical protein